MLKAELAAAYNALHAGRSGPDLAPLAVQYADFAAWQRARLHGGALEAQARYGAPVLSVKVPGWAALPCKVAAICCPSSHAACTCLCPAGSANLS